MLEARGFHPHFSMIDQQDLRRAADREFRKSLDQLGRLKSDADKARQVREQAAIDEVLADIEQFMQQRSNQA